MIEVLLLAAAVLLVVVCGAFVAAEFAFVTVDRASVERAAADGDARARGVAVALRSLSTQLSGAQLGITLTNLLIGFLAEPAIADLIDGPLEAAGVPSGAVTGVALVIALTLSTGFTMVVGELVPKNLAIARPLETARAVQRFMRVFTRVNGPVIRLFNGMANRILRRLGVEPQEELASARSPAGDVMTPRVRMRTLGVDQPVADVIAAARASGFSRFPVVGDGPDGARGDGRAGAGALDDRAGPVCWRRCATAACRWRSWRTSSAGSTGS